MDVLWVIPDIGNYHYARMAAIARHATINLHVVEVFKDSFYEEFRYSGEVEPNLDVTRLGLERGETRSKMSRIIAKTLAGARPDVVLVPGWGEHYALATLQAAKQTETSIVMLSDSTVDDAQRSWWKERIKRRIVRMCSSALVAGKRHTEYITSLGMPHDMVFTGYDVVDNEYFSTQSKAVRTVGHQLKPQKNLPENYFLASNRFVEKKNLTRLLEAYASYVEHAGDESWSLVLLGDGPLRPALIEQARQLGIHDKVLFSGFKHYHELPVYYGLANAFIHASTTEQWGLVVNEAMASGLPVLISERCGCAPDLVEDGVNGYTFDPFDVHGMAARMLQISSNNDAALQAMGQASRDLVQKWSPAAFAESVIKATEAARMVSRPNRRFFDSALLAALTLR
jgi:glycosyltransferase involved in cell wall biosynthesis